jgi:putative membrane protein (TIGR04086 family)
MAEGTRFRDVQLWPVLKGVVAAILVGFVTCVPVGLVGAFLASCAESIPVALPIVILLVPLIAYVCGGYVAARAAEHSELKHAFATGLILLTVLGPVYWGIRWPFLAWWDGLYPLLIIPSTLLGGRIGTPKTSVGRRAARRVDRSTAQIVLTYLSLMFLAPGCVALLCNWGFLPEPLEKPVVMLLLVLPAILLYFCRAPEGIITGGEIPGLTGWGILIVYFIPGLLLLWAGLALRRRALARTDSPS